jgi:DNA mismatch repair ATPase MutS
MTTITTTTTVTPVSVTEIRNGEVFRKMGNSVVVKGPNGLQMFSEGDDLPLFSVMSAKTESKASAIEDALRDVSPDSLSPREALEVLYQLKAKLSK